MRATAALALFLAAGLAPAAPPDLEIPPVVTPTGQYVQFVPKTTAVSVEYVGLDGVEPFPSAFLKDQRAFVLDATSLVKDKQYRFVAVGAGANGEQKRATFVVVNGKATPPPPKDDPPPPPAGLYYFLIVRPDGPAAPAFTKAMGMPEWATLRAAGHLVKDRTASEAVAPAIGVVVPAAQLPAVVTLSVAADGKSSTIVRAAVPLPTTGADVLDLPKGVR